MTEKKDRRIKHTQQRIKDALIQLLEYKPIYNITVKEICEVADINRSTFYAHYSDQHVLFEILEKEVVTELTSQLEKFDMTDIDKCKMDIHQAMYEFIAENNKLCMALIAMQRINSVMNDLIEFVQKRHVMAWAAERGLDPEVSKYIAIFVCSGNVNVVIEWLKSGMKQSPAEMSELTHKLEVEGLRAFHMK